MGVRWKVCGITGVADAREAVAAGADALGLVFHEPSPRCVSPEAAAEIAAAVPPEVLRVGVFVDAAPELMAELAESVGLDVLQLSGDEPPEVCAKLQKPAWKALRFGPRVTASDAVEAASAYSHCTLMVDADVAGAYGGTGETADWGVAARLARQRQLVLAGGLRPDNVAAAIEAVRPWAVDVSSGVEAGPGRKDSSLLAAFSTALEPYR